MKSTVTVTISSDVLARVKELAKDDERSLSAMINILIREALNGKEKAA